LLFANDLVVLGICNDDGIEAYLGLLGCLSSSVPVFISSGVHSRVHIGQEGRQSSCHVAPVSQFGLPFCLSTVLQQKPQILWCVPILVLHLFFNFFQGSGRRNISVILTTMSNTTIRSWAQFPDLSLCSLMSVNDQFSNCLLAHSLFSFEVPETVHQRR